jgi:hypothetical protein
VSEQPAWGPTTPTGVPAPPIYPEVQAEAPPRRRSRWPWVLAGCCAVPAALIGLAVIFVIVIGITHPPTQAKPSDFPTYPGARQTGFYTFVGAGNNGFGPGTTITETYSTPDQVATVTAFFQDRLGTAPYQISNVDPSCGCMDWSRDGGFMGKIRLAGLGTSTSYQVIFHK